MCKTFETALNWVWNGYAVIPIGYRSKRPAGGQLPDYKWEPFKTQLPTLDQLKHWFKTDYSNIGLVMGWNNLVVVDFDLWDAYVLWQQLTGIQTYMVKTARGMHVYLRVKQPTQNTHNDFLDIKANGYVLIPPSTHPNGHQYAIHSDAPILEVESLGSVMPAGFLENAIHTEFQPTPVERKEPMNIWDAVDNPPVAEQDATDTIRKHFQIASLVKGAVQKSSDGRWWVANCPFHEDRNPSFWIDTTRGICGCYKGCTPKPLDVINLYARLHGLTNRDAIYAMRAGL